MGLVGPAGMCEMELGQGLKQQQVLGSEEVAMEGLHPCFQLKGLQQEELEGLQRAEGLHQES